MTLHVCAGLVETAAAIASGQMSAEAAVSLALDRLKAAGDLNCVVALEPEEALAEARRCDAELKAGVSRGPLHGVPLAHKDMYYRAGRISGCGSKIRADFRPETTAPIIQRLDRAGAITVGRLHMAEFAMGPTGHNAHLGRCRNPWLAEAISGGSSSGSGAAVGAGLIAASLGSDTGGSVRLPAAFCGAVGLKPTQGLLPTDGMMKLSESLDCPGPIARCSRDIARLMTVLTSGAQDYEAAAERGAAGLVIGLPARFYNERLDDEVATAIEAARHVFEQLGAQIVDVEIPAQDGLSDLANLVWAPEAAALHLPWLQSRPGDYGEQVRNRLLQGLTTTAVAYIDAKRQRNEALDAMLHGPLATCDMLLTPVCRRIVPLADDVDVGGGERMRDVVADISAFTRPISFLGLPALVTPMGFDRRGVPIALQLIGRPLGEGALLAAASAYEGATNWLKAEAGNQG
jgi:aspartyl-tRNA(Asn)/glutamyl-tRNA(Gln) amidotransferase subunit A